MNDRKQQVRRVLETYTQEYTSAQFAEKLSQVKEESEAAQAWFEQKRKELNISDSEIMEITQELRKEAQEKGTAFFCNIKRS